jgi:hypothetical protein
MGFLLLAWLLVWAHIVDYSHSFHLRAHQGRLTALVSSKLLPKVASRVGRRNDPGSSSTFCFAVRSSRVHPYLYSPSNPQNFLRLDQPLLSPLDISGPIRVAKYTVGLSLLAAGVLTYRPDLQTHLSSAVSPRVAELVASCMQSARRVGATCKHCVSTVAKKVFGIVGHDDLPLLNLDEWQQFSVLDKEYMGDGISKLVLASKSPIQMNMGQEVIPCLYLALYCN